MDEMDMMLMQTSSVDRDVLKISKSFSYSTGSPTESTAVTRKAINPLKFHLVTTEEHGGYMLSLSTLRITHFRRILESSGLFNLDVETACNHIISKGRTKLSKKCFDSAFQTLLSTQSQGFPIDKTTKRTITGVFDSLFKAFDREKSGEVSAIEVACGFTVLCRGKKSDKLEFAFEVLDKRKRGRLSRSDMSNYLRSFLTVLLNVAFTSSLDCDPVDDTVSTMSGGSCDKSTGTLIRVVKAGADWAASLAFRDFVPARNEQRSSMSFDDFASWYTRTGYSSIPWLELLDLQKWAMVQ
jgi:Ca2+-binding EF-hand superfamily protein